MENPLRLHYEWLLVIYFTRTYRVNHCSSSLEQVLKTTWSLPQEPKSRKGTLKFEFELEFEFECESKKLAYHAEAVVLVEFVAFGQAQRRVVARLLVPRAVVVVAHQVHQVHVSKNKREKCAVKTIRNVAGKDGRRKELWWWPFSCRRRTLRISPKENAKENQKKNKNKRRCHALGDLGDVVADAGRGRRRAQRHRQQQLIFGKLLAQLLFPIKSNIQKKWILFDRYSVAPSFN